MVPANKIKDEFNLFQIDYLSLNFLPPLVHFSLMANTDLFDDGLEDLHPLFPSEGIELADVAQDEDPIVLAVDHVPDCVPEILLVDLQGVVMKRCRDGGNQRPDRRSPSTTSSLLFCLRISSPTSFLPRLFWLEERHPCTTGILTTTPR